MRRLRIVSVLVALLAVTTAAASQDGRPQIPPESVQPPAPRVFAAPESDPAGRVARLIAAIVPRFPNLRARRRLGQWRHDPRAVWSVRSEAECMAELARLGIEARLVHTRATPIPTPVRLLPRVGGVRYRGRGQNDPFIASCELVARLPYLSEVLARHGIDDVLVVSAWRHEPPESFHRMGMALDIRSFHGPSGSLVVETDYPRNRSRPTCPPPEGAPLLQQIACELAAGGRFSTVITPAYSPGHHNHFHVDVRPDDPRVFVR